MSEAIRRAMARFPEKNAWTEPKEGRIEKIFLCECLNREADFVEILKELRDAPDGHGVRHLSCEFSKNYDAAPDGIVPFQKVFDLLAEHGPYPHLKHVDFDCEYWEPMSPIRDLSGLTRATPHLTGLDILTNQVQRLEKPFSLDHLDRLTLNQIDVESLRHLSACSFPKLRVLEVEICLSDKDERETFHQALVDFFKGDWAPGLERMFLSLELDDDDQQSWVPDAFVEGVPDSPLLKRLKFLSVDEVTFTDDQLDRLATKKDAYVHLDRFYLDATSRTWPAMKERVGDFVSTPSEIRQRELHDIATLPASRDEADEQQRELGYRVNKKDVEGASEPALVAGLSARRKGDRIAAAVAVLRKDTLELVESSTAEAAAGPDFGPGFEAYRDATPLLTACSLLKSRPDLLVVDGHGTDHRREFGIACHLGKILDVPALGCAESPLYGTFEEPGPKECDFSVVREEEENRYDRGLCVRTRAGEEPVFVSIGHKVTLNTAANRVLQLSPQTRIPVPILKAREFLDGIAPR